MTGRFTYLYITLLVTLFAVFYWDVSPIARVVNEYQTKMLLFILDMGLPDGHLQGIDIMISPRYKIIITQACNGMIPFLVFLAAIWAYPALFLHKLKWSFYGYLLFFVVNVIRLFIVVYFVTITPEYFWISHDIFGNALLISFGLSMFYIYLITIKKR